MASLLLLTFNYEFQSESEAKTSRLIVTSLPVIQSQKNIC